MLAVALGVLVYNTTQQVINFFKYDHITKLDITFVHELGKDTVNLISQYQYIISHSYLILQV